MGSVIDNIGSVISGLAGASGVDLWVKVIGGVLLPLIMLLVYFWVKRKAAAEAEELAKKQTDQQDRKDREETRNENNAENAALQAAADAAKKLKDAAKNFP